MWQTRGPGHFFTIPSIEISRTRSIRSLYQLFNNARNVSELRRCAKRSQYQPSNVAIVQHRTGAHGATPTASPLLISTAAQYQGRSAATLASHRICGFFDRETVDPLVKVSVVLSKDKQSDLPLKTIGQSLHSKPIGRHPLVIPFYSMSI